MLRTKIPSSVIREVLTESGYRCAVPTCRSILAIDLHHIVEVRDGGPNDQANLLALCPTCHALYTRGTIARASINAWKTMLIALNHAFDKESISNLLFLYKNQTKIEKKMAELMSVNYGELMCQANKSIELIRPSNAGFASDVRGMNLLLVSGDGVLKFSHLIASDLADYIVVPQERLAPLYFVSLTNKGKHLVDAWFSGSRNAVKEALSTLPEE